MCVYIYIYAYIVQCMISCLGVFSQRLARPAEVSVGDGYVLSAVWYRQMLIEICRAPLLGAPSL